MLILMKKLVLGNPSQIIEFTSAFSTSSGTYYSINLHPTINSLLRKLQCETFLEVQ